MRSFAKYLENRQIRLWLDDERNPQDPNIKKLFGTDGTEVWVKTVPEAIDLIKQGNVSHISFDHDLADPSGDGIVLARWIEEQAALGKLSRIPWDVHSQSIVGRQNIKNAMMSAERFWSNQ